MKKVLIGISIIIAAFIVFTLINKPSKGDLKSVTDQYLQEEYNKAETLYLKDSIYYSSFNNIRASTEAIFNTIEYKTPVVLVEKERKDLINEMATPEDVTRRLTWAMENRGGTLDIEIYATTYSGANTGNYRIVVTDKDSKEIYREDLKSSSAHSTTHDRSFGKEYWNLATVRLKDRVPIPFKVYLINLLNSSREEFIIDRTL